MCFRQNRIPDPFRIEKMILLYKNKGEMDDINNYRGIFIRLLILIIYQKWLYSKAAPILDWIMLGQGFNLAGGKGNLGKKHC